MPVLMTSQVPLSSAKVSNISIHCRHVLAQLKLTTFVFVRGLITRCFCIGTDALIKRVPIDKVDGPTEFHLGVDALIKLVFDLLTKLMD